MIRTLIVLISVFLCAAPAAAQTTLERRNLQREIEKGRPLIFEVDAPGDSVVGRIHAIDDEAIDVELGSGIRRIRFADVSRISREGDSNLNGAAIGLAIFGGWCTMVCGQAVSSGGRYVGVVARMGIFGAGLGALIDSSSKGTTTLFRRPTNLRVGARVSPRAAGVRATLTW